MSPAQYECLRFEQAGLRASISFNRPDQLNALNARMIEEALDALSRVHSDIRVLIVRGVGTKAFAAGADIHELERRTAWTELDAGPRRELARGLERAPFLTVAAINGLALGGGLELALACHLRVASSRAQLGLPELRLGLIPGNGGTARLPRLIGRAKALRAVLLSERFDAEEAFKIGLVDWVVPQEEFDGKLDGIVSQLEGLPSIATRAVVDCIIQGAGSPQDTAIEREHRWFQICLASEDKNEGVSAFLAKRMPQFGRRPG